MARGKLTLFDGGKLERWADGFDQLAKGPTAEFREEWAHATERTYLESQTLVHIDTGFLKSTGDWSTDEAPAELVSEVSYEASRAQLDAEQARRDAEASARAAARGRTFRPKPGRKRLENYGKYEHDRGAEHAWLSQAFVRSGRQFERALVRGYERLVRSWR